MDGGWLHLQGGEEVAPAAVPACWRTEATVQLIVSREKELKDEYES
jgi:hypothetical protein